MSFLFSSLLAFLLSVTILPAVLQLARAKGWYDSTGGRKIHNGNIPRLGGVAIAWGFFLSTIMVYAVYRPLGKLMAPGLHFWLLMAIGAGYHMLGLADDFLDLAGRPKLLIQALLAMGVLALGYGFRVIELPFAPYRLDLGIVGPFLTFFWIVGMCNAVNLIDGMDGLAGGVSFIAVAFWAVVFYMEAQYLPAIVATAAAGSILGFLFFNFPPANVFMGDSGSLFLGFILAVLPLLGDANYREQAGLIPAITMCLVPLLDTISAIIRRWKLGVSFFTADRYHVHHKLLNIGFSTRQSLALIYVLAAISGASTLSIVYLNGTASWWVMIGAWTVVTAFFLVMHYLKENEIRFADRAKSSFNKEPEE